MHGSIEAEAFHLLFELGLQLTIYGLFKCWIGLGGVNRYREKGQYKTQGVFFQGQMLPPRVGLNGGEKRSP